MVLKELVPKYHFRLKFIYVHNLALRLLTETIDRSGQFKKKYLKSNSQSNLNNKNLKKKKIIPKLPFIIHPRIQVYRWANEPLPILIWPYPSTPEIKLRTKKKTTIPNRPSFGTQLRTSFSAFRGHFLTHGPHPISTAEWNI